VPRRQRDRPRRRPDRPRRRRVLLLLPTTTYKAQDFLDAADRLGIETVVGSETRQALQDIAPGHTVTLDLGHPARAAAQITRFAATRRLDAVIPTDDQSAIVAAAAARRLGLPHNPPAAALAARHKDQMRRRLAIARVPQPRFHLLRLPAATGAGRATTASGRAGLVAGDLDAVLRRAAARQTYPCVLKPTSLAASRGVIRADDTEAFVAAARRIVAILDDVEQTGAGSASAAPPPAAVRRLLIEEYIPGLEVAVEGLLRRGRLRMLALFDKPDPLEGPYFEETIYVTPSRLSAATQRVVERTTAAAARALGLRDGPVHAELRIPPPSPGARPAAGARPEKASSPRVIEIAARSIGGLCARALRFGTGLSLEDVVLLHATGRNVARLRRERAAAGVMMIPIPRAGVLRDIHDIAAARRVPGVRAITISATLGKPITPLPEGHAYLGFIFARGRTPAAVESALRAAHRRLRIVID